MKKLLLALDCSQHSQRAADYVTEILPHLPQCELVLFSVVSGIPYSEEELTKLTGGKEQDPKVHGDEDHQRELGQIQTFFNDVCARLEEKGFPAARVQRRIQPLRRGYGQDIMDAAKESDCDTIAVGRRGQSKIRELFGQSVSHDTLHCAGAITVWVVG